MHVDAPTLGRAVATNPNMTGEATVMQIAGLPPQTVRGSRLASGLPVGGDLEYADELTPSRALTGPSGVRRADIE